MAGLFANPQDVMIAEQQALRQAGSSPTGPQDVLRGSLFNLGNTGGNAAVRGFGGDDRSAAQKRAADLQGFAKGINFKDPNSIMAGVNRMNEGGYQAEAFKLLEAIPTPLKPQKQVVDEWVQSEQVGDTMKKFLLQRDNFGFINKVGEISDTLKADTAGSLFKFSQAWDRDVNFDKASESSFLGRVGNREEFKSFVDDTDPEQMVQFTGLIQKVANDLKDADRQRIANQYNDGQITAQQGNLLTPKSDDAYLDSAYERFVKGGGLAANIDTGLTGVGGADVTLNPDANTTDAATLSSNERVSAARRQAVSDVAARAGQLVVADPRTGGFRMNKMTPQQAQSVFSRMDGKDDEAIRAELEQSGFTFTPELFESHAKQWQFMRENPVAVQKFLTLADTPDLQEAEITRHLDELEENLNFPAFAQSAEVFKYMRRLSQPTKRRTTRFKN